MNKIQEPLWYWDKKPIQLSKLDEKQLHFIKDAITKSNKFWFGQSKNYWLSKINPLLKKYERQHIKDIASYKNQKRLKDATKMADIIISVFNKSKSN